MPGPTYREIAQALGVSTATVSRALAGELGVSSEMAQRVRDTAASLGYRSNRAAKALRKQRADAIGLVISDVENPFFASVARAIEGVAAEHRHAVLLCNTDEDLDQESLYLDLMIGENVAGVIVAPSAQEIGPLEQLRSAGIPTVTLDRKVAGDPFDAVLVDHRLGARELVAHLVDHGHRQIAAVMGTTAATPSLERLAGCREAIADAASAQLTVIEGTMRQAVGVQGTFELGERLAIETLSQRDRPSAVFCANGLISLGVLRAVRRLGLRVPEDIAVVGFDDQPFFDLLDPPLTVAAQPVEDLGRAAADLLFDRLADSGQDVRSVILPPTIHVRRSCGCPAASASG
ncbi:LacI family DNA-binding transcriptional regulator [Phytoactinopolyspora mesophila]|uniref:Substrate-binding domain-containing protein n=1 Tax=Phytoactinopolyspora mesophila TaxID=2650750 RepID=A0A7K3M9C3_9ACTN|nr:LacI family DNA-binding transcriptional regulator [Phytoactinopolyspora mesophila]NDL59889.1 substrate-binding domain-containing protein [Phytoactinopolyspora mesophila]